MSQALTQAELFALLHAGQSVILPHAHAARTLRARYAEAAPTLGPSPEAGTALAWGEWVHSFWSGLTLDGREERVLLNRAQEDQLWTDIIGGPASASGASSLTSPQAVHLARSGLQLAAAYNAVGRLRSLADSFDTRTFASWVDAFQEVCTRQRLLAPAFLESTLTGHLRAGSLAHSENLHFVGVEEFTPAQRDLLTAFRRAGTEVQHSSLVTAETRQSPGTAIRLADPQEQLRFAVRWIARQARQLPGTFAIVTSRAEEHRPALQRLLRQVLAPELDSVAADLSSTPWHFTSNPPLSSSVVVAHAFGLLRWTHQPLSLENIGQLLLSPYFTFAEPLETRARFEANALRNGRLLRPELDLFQFLDFLAKVPRKAHIPHFPELQALARLAGGKFLRTSTRLHADWADGVRSLLVAAGWPGPRTLTANEFTSVEAWDGLLDLLSTLDRNGRRLPFTLSLQQLEAEINQASSASASLAAPVQILTLEEAQGIPFDHVLVLDATDRDFPVPQRAHPLLPRRLQTSLAMPGIDPSTTYQRTRRQLQNLLDGCSSVHLLAPAEDLAGPLHLTQLAHDLGFAPTDPASILPHEATRGPIALAEMEDRAHLPGLSSTTVHGGARVLELQAACGFRAFADLRLRAEEPQALSLGLSSREAGSRLHDALHRLWQELGTQANLRSLAMLDRRAIVEAAVEEALRPLTVYPGAERPWTEAFLQVLQTRFVDLLLSWLPLELERAPFEAVAGEQEAIITVGPLQLKLRPDRIDKVDNGLVYIDYKTRSSLSNQDWLGSRPDAPQLPLYTLLAEPGQVRGLAFGRLRPGKDLGWISLSDTPGIFPGEKHGAYDLEAEAENWREELTRLAQAFADGETDVDPKTYPKTCEFCAARLLCRLNPEELLSQAEEKEEAEDEISV